MERLTWAMEVQRKRAEKAQRDVGTQTQDVREASLPPRPPDAKDATEATPHKSPGPASVSEETSPRDPAPSLAPAQPVQLIKLDPKPVRAPKPISVKKPAPRAQPELITRPQTAPSLAEEVGGVALNERATAKQCRLVGPSTSGSLTRRCQRGGDASQRAADGAGQTAEGRPCTRGGGLQRTDPVTIRMRNKTARSWRSETSTIYMSP